jgi:hypothetical protein
MRHILAGITLLIVCAAVGSAQDRKADLVILTNQGATPGVKALAAAFGQAGGHRYRHSGRRRRWRNINSGAADITESRTIEPFVRTAVVAAR